LTKSNISLFQSLRVRILMMLLTAAAIGSISAILLAYGLISSQQLVDKAQAAQVRIENYLVLASRLNEYRDATTVVMVQDSSIAETAQRINQAYEPVRSAFTALLSLNILEVDNETGDGKTAAATKGLNISRMRAQFENLHSTIRSSIGKSGNISTAQGALNAFGIGTSPILFQTMENERQLSASLHQQITLLRQKLISVSIALALATLALAVVLYVKIGRPLLRRIAETIEGADAIAGGKLGTRLTASGHDELTALMNQFNVMAASMAARQSDLKKAQNDLQQTVDRQTADLRQANEKLENIDKNRRRFFSDISHELRTPLTVVQGEAEFNLNPRAKPKAADMRQSFKTILCRVQSLRRRVDDMLRVARSESGRLDLAVAPVSLNEVVQDSITEESVNAKRRAIDLRFTSPIRQYQVMGDHDWLRQVISGLIDNAIKNSPENTNIKLELCQTGKNAETRIIDAGAGIDPDTLPHVFDRFIRGEKNNEAATGSSGFGIGLNLAKWIIEEHSGTIALRNNTNGPGLTVYVTLPLLIEASDEVKST
jgi:signal transduction histidine kinase